MAAYSFVQIDGSAGNVSFGFSFPYLIKLHIHVKIDGEETTAFTWTNANTIHLNTPLAADAIVEIRRLTPVSEAQIVFVSGSSFSESDLNNADLQLLYVGQELYDQITNAVSLNAVGQMDALEHRIENLEDPIDPQDAATKAYTDGYVAATAAAVTIAIDAALVEVTDAADAALIAVTDAKDAALLLIDDAVGPSVGDATDAAIAAAASAAAAVISASTATTQASTATTQAGIATAQASAASTDASDTAADKIACDADKVACDADKVACDADVIACAASASAASGSASAASGSASAASGSASAASGSASAASGSASTASTDAGTSTAQAVISTAQAVISTAQASAASASAIAANASAIAAAASQAGSVALQNTIDAKGDLLIGTADNTATRLPVGTNGQHLISDSNIASGARWASHGLSQRFSGLYMRRNTDLTLKASQILIKSCNEVIFDDGERVTSGLAGLIADITVSGAGGLDTGAETASRWYEVHIIRRRDTGAISTLLHKCLNRKADAFLMTGSVSVSQEILRLSTSTATDKLAQSYTAITSGPVYSADIKIFKQGAPTGNYWVTLEADTAGSPSGTPLATSRKNNVARCTTTATGSQIRMIFDTPFTQVATTQYWLVLQGDYTRSDTVGIEWRGSTTAADYGSNASKKYNGSVWSATATVTDFLFQIWVEENAATSLSMPANYDQKCLVGYVFNDSGSDFIPFSQFDREVTYGNTPSSLILTSSTTAPHNGLNDNCNLWTVVPPIPCRAQFGSGVGGSVCLLSVGDVTVTDMSNTATALEGTVVMVTTTAANSPVPTPFLPLDGLQVVAHGTGATASIAFHCTGFTF